MSDKQRLLANSRMLRSHMTDSEIILWKHLRKKQILGIKFNRQKPIGRYILDFYSAQIKLAVEIDGAQHFDLQNQQYDFMRDKYLLNLGIKTIRFMNIEIFNNLHNVLEVIYRQCHNLI